MCPIVPMFTCGFVRSYFAFAITTLRWPRPSSRRQWSPCPGLNRRPRPYQGRALPTELHGHSRHRHRGAPRLRRGVPNAWGLGGHFGAPMSIWSGKRDSNPRPPAWKAGALPLSYSRAPSRRAVARPRSWWGEEDLNPRRRPPADLQSAPFGQLGYLPAYPQTVTPRDETLNRLKCLALAGGFEPPTHCLQGSCSTPELRQQTQNFTLGPTSM